MNTDLTLKGDMSIGCGKGIFVYAEHILSEIFNKVFFDLQMNNFYSLTFQRVLVLFQKTDNKICKGVRSTLKFVDQ